MKFTIQKVRHDLLNAENDEVAIEEPLEIKILYGIENEMLQKIISVTMRTPGNDAELARGFLFTEGIITNAEDISNIYQNKGNENVINVDLKSGLAFNLSKMERNFYTTSSCGVCGKSSIEAIRTICPFPQKTDLLKISLDVLYTLPGKLKLKQEIFKNTGGIHGCALFDTEGNLLLSREDVGRHNAVEKLVGAAINLSMLPMNQSVLLLSGRASFELIQKAWMTGIKVVAAIGAPSSLAIQLARESGITLVGFLKEKSFNIYSEPGRIHFNTAQNIVA